MHTLKLGDKGLVINDLQKQLLRLGYSVTADGDFGQATQNAVREFQRDTGLVIDGVVGPKTWAALHNKKIKPLLKEADLIEAAERLSLPLSTIKAINQIESHGEGMGDNGKPKILFERHVMHKRLLKKLTQSSTAERAQEKINQISARHYSVINPKTGGYTGGIHEWGRLGLAMGIDQEIAQESASWGLFQIMGYHWQSLGYKDINAFVEAQQTESGQWDTFIRFIEANPNLHKALKNKQWAEFAAGYNGPNYKANLYDIKLERAAELFAAHENPSSTPQNSSQPSIQKTVATTKPKEKTHQPQASNKAGADHV